MGFLARASANAATALLISAGLAPGSVSLPAGSIAGTPSLARYPTGNVLPDEPIMVYVDSTSGFSVTDEFEEIDFQWSLDNLGATYATGGAQDNNANLAAGRTACVAWSSPGTKSPTVTARTTAGAADPVSLSVVVDNPDTDRTWDAIIYYSQAGDFSGAPAVGGNIYHESTPAGVNSRGGANDSVWVIMRKGETYSWAGTAFDATDNGMLWYITGDSAYRSFGSGANPRVNATQTADFVSKGGATSRVIISDVDFYGGYDPATGLAPNGQFTVVSALPTTGAEDNHSIALCRVLATGISRCISGGGAGGTANGNPYITLWDTEIYNWFDYGVTSSSGETQAAYAGCWIMQDPLAILRDAKDGVPGAPDHGPTRFNGCARFSADSCILASANGWSNYGGDKFIQPCLRLYPQQDNDMQVNVQKCWLAGSQPLATDRHTPTDSVVGLYEKRVIFDRNRCWIGRQTFGAIGMNATGLYARNNVFYYANVYQDRGPAVNSVLFCKTPNYSSAVGEALTRPIKVDFNTVVSDRTATSGGVGNWQEVTYDTALGAWPGTSATFSQNVYEVPNHANSGSFTDDSPLSRGDNFKMATGSAGLGAVTSGAYPVRDHDGNLRSLPTNRGAHHDSVSSTTAVSAPVNTAIPTIAELTSFTDEWAASSFGTWNNWSGMEQYLVAFSWKIDGSPVTNDDFNVNNAAAQSGSLTLDIIATNLSGTRTTATSAGSTVP